MRSILSFAFAALFAAPAISAARPVAQWDVVPHQRLKEPFKAGVVAFYDKPFYVEFTINGKKAAKVDNPTLNDRTKVVEHWFTIDPASFDIAKLKENKLVVGAKAVAEDGTSHKLPDLLLYCDKDGNLGSKKTIWLDQADGIDYNEGTKESPVKTMKQAVKRAGDGGTVFLSKPGVYTAERIGGGNDRKYWTTIMPAPGLTRKDIRIKGGRTGCDKLKFKDVQIFCDIEGGQGYALAGVDDKSSCWLEDCIVRNKGGRAVARTFVFGNRLTGYVTGGATTEMANGPCCKIVRNHMPYTYMALILSALSDEAIDTYIGAPAQEDEVVVLEMSVGEVYKLPALGKADQGPVIIKWSSSNEEVAGVSPLGLLAAKKAGNANLTATGSDGKQGVVEVHVVAD